MQFISSFIIIITQIIAVIIIIIVKRLPLIINNRNKIVFAFLSLSFCTLFISLFLLLHHRLISFYVTSKLKSYIRKA